MSYITTIGYHGAYFEVEIIVCNSSKTKDKAETLGNNPNLDYAILYHDKIVVGKGDQQFTIFKSDTYLYQFRICRNKNKDIVSDVDYKSISWDEAIQYFHTEYKNSSLPYSLEAYYFAVHKEGFTLS